ncbi:MAG: L-ribulose-5-phosphate 4-epimerase [Clostridiales bacterium]|nr:L-ribulose-5-phosphate 4-epimerase [Clostridiales bacterium]
MLEKLKESVLQANLELVRLGLVLFTWGNASAIDRENGLVVIKPSGVAYINLKAEDMVVVDLEGHVMERGMQPSSDLPTHLELYQSFRQIGGVVHTHSQYATSFAQAGRGIPAYGTTHADYFFGEIPCSRAMTAEEIASSYERNTGRVIAELFQHSDAQAVPGCVVRNHGVFAWGLTVDQAGYHAAVLEYCAKMAFLTEQLSPGVRPADACLLEKHFRRKHGVHAYYGQKEKQ